jgi:protein-disulfide isomerase
MMRARLFIVLASLLLGAAAPPRDWRATATESNSGWTFGRPGAPLLAEYASLGCPTCARFAEASGPAVLASVQAGRIRYSVRPFLIFPHDRAAYVLARCVPASRRLAYLKAVLAAQPQTRARLAEVDGDDDRRQRLFEAELAGPVAHSTLLAELSGLGDLAASHGLASAAARTCLADTAHHAWVTEADLNSRLSGVTSTPTYDWNGSRLPRALTPEQLAAKLPR